MSRNQWVGEVLGGRYRIEEILGQGGMSAVYKAHDPNLKRVVAVKMIHTHLADDPQFLLRFEEEATAVARLRHPNIVQVYDFNHDDGLYYMVQEFLPGETLQERLRRLSKAGRRLPVAEAIRYALNICDAVGYAHQRGMIHRDIKPANIMLDVHGQAILMDFGIVKISGGERHTATGAVVGTALYMPPEVIRGEVPDPRSDLYSLGVTLYEMVSGRPPFEADSAMTLMMMHLQEPVPDLRPLRPDVPEALTAIVLKAMAKDRDMRFRSAEEMAQALQRGLEKGIPDAGAIATEFDGPGLPPSADPVVLRGPVARPGRPATRQPRTVPEPAPYSTPPTRREPEPAGQRAWTEQSPQPGPEPPGPRLPTPRMERSSAPKQPSRINRTTLTIAGVAVLLVLALGATFAALRSDGDDEQAGVPPTEEATRAHEALPGPTEMAADLADVGIAAATLPAAGDPLPTAEPTATDIPTVAPTATPTLTPTPSRTPTVTPTPEPTIPVGVPYARIKGITVDNQGRYVVEYETFEFTPQLPGVHLHFFFDTVPPEQAGVPGNGPWKIYGGIPPYVGMAQAERPTRAGQLCVLVGNADHSVQLNSGTCSALPDVVVARPTEDLLCRQGPGLDYPTVTEALAGHALLVLGISPDESWWNVADPHGGPGDCWLPLEATTFSGDLSTVALVTPPEPPAGPAPATLAVEITGITINDLNQYVVEFVTAGFTPQLPGTHIHFFFDTEAPDQVGLAGSGMRLMHGGPSPFTGYGPGDRPAEAGQMCAIQVNPDHSVVLGSGNCFPLPG